MIKSWDIFDTLIARKCIHPRKVFHLVEEKSGFKDFAKMRVAAENTMLKENGHCTLDGIYKKLMLIANIDDAKAQWLKQLEIDEELEQAIPIVENVNQVSSGDFLISDMYLPAEVIHRMLDKIGLLVPVEIIITSGGKASGKVWQQLSDQGMYICHTGDNRNSDVKKPREFGFDSVYTNVSAANVGEKELLEKDAAFAEYLRSIRLRNPFTEQIKRHYWTLATANIGILLIIAKLIETIQQKYQFNYVGFCGRDSYYLYLLYRKLNLSVANGGG